MNTELINRCNLLVKNRDTIHGAFKWEQDEMALAGSSFYVGLNIAADAEILKECEDLLKSKAGIFSEYRGNVKMPLLCKMAVSVNPEKYFEDIKNIVMQMKKLKWIDKDYKILAAMTIYDHVEDMAKIPEIIEKVEVLYHGMKEKHPWLTSDEDIPFAAMLAVSGMNTDALIEEMENCYSVLKEKFHDKDAVQSLSHVLAVNSSGTEEKCRKIEKIFDILKAEKHKYGTGYELAVLGTLCVLEIPVETIAGEIIEADDYLKKQKGFGDFRMGTEIRRMYAALMVMDTHMPPASLTHESLVDTTLVIVIAMEICMLIMMTTICTTSASAVH